MGSLILCHKKRAKQPYMITRVHIRIYTIEELCYYICNNLYLIDYTLMNRQLCEWIREELHMWELADQLLGQMEKNCTAEQFVLTILVKSNVYSPGEINKVQNMLEKLQNQKDVERAKHKADSLLASKEYALAVLVYQSIVKNEWDDSVDKSFYGKVYGCLGTAYGQQFLYEEAAAAYKEAYRLSEDPEMLKAYMYCAYRSMPEAEYVKMLSGNSVYLSMDSLLKEELKQARRSVDMDVTDEKLEIWKKEYRRIDKCC